MMKRIIFILIFFICGCTLSPSTDYKELSRQLSVGMTKEEVINILGNPQDKTVLHEVGDDSNSTTEKFIYSSDSKTATTVGNIITFPIMVIGSLGALNGGPIAPPIFSSSSSSLEVEFDTKTGLVKGFHAY